MIRTSFLSLISTIIKLLVNLIITKVISVNYGSIGLIQLGNFQNLFQIVTNTSLGGINNGIIKFTSEYAQSKRKLGKLLKSTLVVVLFCTIVTMLVMFCTSGSISKIIFKDLSKGYVIQITALCLLFYSVNIIFTSYLNGIGKIKILTIVNVTQSILSLLLTLILIQFFKYEGILISIPLSQVAIFTFVVFLLFSVKKFIKFIAKIDISFFDIKNLLSFSLMTLTSAIISPLSNYYARSYIQHSFGEHQTGVWQASQYVSTVHLFLLTTSLSVYFLPVFSKLKENTELKKELFKGLKFIILIVLLSSIFIYIFRDTLINLLFSKDFFELKNFVLYQIVSDFFKIMSWLFAYLLIAKNMVKKYILFELLAAFTYVLSLILLPQYIGVDGIYLASILQYFIYLIMLVYTFRFLIRS